MLLYRLNSRGQITDSLSSFHKKRLPRDQQDIYDIVDAAILRKHREVVCPAGTDVRSVMFAVDFDRPEYFFIDWYNVRYREYPDRTVISFSYLYNHEYISEVEKRLAGKAAEIRGANRCVKELAVHDMILQTVRYDCEQLAKARPSPSIYNLSGPLMNGSGVCEGIAKYAAFLLRHSGVPSTVVTGKADDHTGAFGNHAWNVVETDHGLFHLDVTYDIGISANGFISREYFNKSGTAMSSDHKLKMPL